MSEKNESQVRNSFVGATTFGLGGSLAVAVGAAIRKNNVRDEALTVLIGGVITGIVAGYIGSYVPGTDKNAHFYLRFATAVANSALTLAASCSAPLVGEMHLGRGTAWRKILIDQLIGEAALLGGLLAGLGAFGACEKVIYSSNRFFPQPPSLPNNDEVPVATRQYQ